MIGLDLGLVAVLRMTGIVIFGSGTTDYGGGPSWEALRLIPVSILSWCAVDFIRTRRAVPQENADKTIGRSTIQKGKARYLKPQKGKRLILSLIVIFVVAVCLVRLTLGSDLVSPNGKLLLLYLMVFGGYFFPLPACIFCFTKQPKIGSAAVIAILLAALPALSFTVALFIFS